MKCPLVEACYLYANRYCSITGVVVIPNRLAFKNEGFKEDLELSKDVAAISLLSERIKKVCTEY